MKLVTGQTMATEYIYGEATRSEAFERTPLHQPPKQSVLVLSDDPSFARDLASRCQIERNLPAFTVIGSESFVSNTANGFDVAIVGGVNLSALETLLRSLEAQGVPVICVVPDAHSLLAVRHAHPRMAALQQHDFWLDSVVLLSNEILRRAELQKRLRRVEQTLAAESGNAALGRYMLDARHQFANALTGVLGNAELLQMNGELLTKPMREQVDTIHAMALRLHEMLQRFSSLATEMSFAEKKSHSETA